MSNEPIKVGVAVQQRSNTILNVGGQAYDLANVFEGIDLIGASAKLIQKSPYSTEPMKMIGRAQTLLVGAMQQMPQALVPVIHPLVKAASGPMLEAAKEAVRLRMQAAHTLMKNPTQSIPLTLLPVATFAIGSTATFTIQNPYQGSGGGVYNTNALWAITGLESGALVNTGGLIITSAIFAGHDYVQASLNGIQTVTGTGNATGTNRGWDFSIFASDKRYRDHTIFSPWNLQGAGGIIGSIMRETGQVKLSLTNVGNSTFAGGAFHVHVKASLCGSPFQPDHVQKMYVPWAHQLESAHQLSMNMPMGIAKMLGSRLGNNSAELRGIEEEINAFTAY